jgi:hypothetical protein
MRSLNRRQILEETWLDLVNHILPEFAEIHHLPIRHNHCFARCIYDNVLDSPWDTIVDKPAYKHLSDLDLEIAIILAKQVLDNPTFIKTLNTRSLQMRTPTPPSHTNNIPNNTLSL